MANVDARLAGLLMIRKLKKSEEYGWERKSNIMELNTNLPIKLRDGPRLRE